MVHMNNSDLVLLLSIDFDLILTWCNFFSYRRGSLVCCIGIIQPSTPTTLFISSTQTVVLELSLGSWTHQQDRRSASVCLTSDDTIYVVNNMEYVLIITDISLTSLQEERVNMICSRNEQKMVLEYFSNAVKIVLSTDQFQGIYWRRSNVCSALRWYALMLYIVCMWAHLLFYQT